MLNDAKYFLVFSSIWWNVVPRNQTISNPTPEELNEIQLIEFSHSNLEKKTNLHANEIALD